MDDDKMRVRSASLSDAVMEHVNSQQWEPDHERRRGSAERMKLVRDHHDGQVYGYWLSIRWSGKDRSWHGRVSRGDNGVPADPWPEFVRTGGHPTAISARDAMDREWEHSARRAGS